MESGEIGLRHVDDLFADVDAVVAVYLADLVEADDEGPVYSHELLWGEHLLDGLHREMGDEWSPLAVEVEHHVVLHAADVDDVADGYLAVLAVDFEEEVVFVE